jgi:uncharacterized protein (TIGR03083 family)
VSAGDTLPSNRISRTLVGRERYVRAMSSPSRPVTNLDKTATLEGLFAVWHDIDALLDGLGEQHWQTHTSLPGWNVHDVTSHLIGTESMLQGAATPEADVDVSTLKHVRNDVGVLNERWVRKLRGVGAADLLERFRTTTAQRRKALSDMGDDEWNQITATPAGPDTYGRFMRVRVFDCWMHELDIRDAIGQPDANLGGASSTLALDEMAASMGFVVGKLGSAPDGSRVAIELTGPLARTIHVDVQGRAKVVDDFGDDEPTATIRLDGVLFSRLAGGRTTPARHADAIAYGGDRAVAERIVEHLNYVI